MSAPTVLITATYWQYVFPIRITNTDTSAYALTVTTAMATPSTSLITMTTLSMSLTLATDAGVAISTNAQRETTTVSDKLVSIPRAATFVQSTRTRMVLVLSATTTVTIAHFVFHLAIREDTNAFAPMDSRVMAFHHSPELIFSSQSLHEVEKRDAMTLTSVEEELTTVFQKLKNVLMSNPNLASFIVWNFTQNQHARGIQPVLPTTNVSNLT